MRKFLLLLLFLQPFAVNCNAQCWVGILKNEANMFSGPSSESEFMVRLEEESVVILDEMSKKNGYFSVYSVNNERYGYVAAKNVELLKEYDCDDAEGTLNILKQIINDESEMEEDELEDSEEYEEELGNDNLQQSSKNSTSELWLGYTTTDVYLRSDPSTNNSPLTKIPKGSALAFNNSTLDNGFYYTCYIDKDLYGYVSQKFIAKVKEIKNERIELNEIKDEKKVGQDPELHITNDADVGMTLRVNNKVNYPFKAHEKKTITVPPGKVSLIVSSPGTIPYNGTSEAKAGWSYEHKFYLTTVRSKKK